MAIVLQIALGGALLILCALMHLAVAARALSYLRHAQPFVAQPSPRRFFKVTGGLFAVFLASHTVQIYLWAIAVWLTGALTGREPPIYFALVTYTTLGYGDVTLSEGFRVFGAMASVTGILMFGLTTAFLVGVFSNALNAARKK